MLQGDTAIWCAKLRKPLRLSDSDIVQSRHLQAHADIAVSNRSFAELHGFSSATDVRGLPLRQFLSRAESNATEWTFPLIRSHYNIKALETCSLRHDGRTIVALNRIIGSTEKGIVKSLWGIQQDITGEKRVLIEPSMQLTSLTVRKQQVLRLIADGKSNKEIASLLLISAKTVEAHRGYLMQHLHAHTAGQLVCIAIQLGLLDSDRDTARKAIGAPFPPP